MKLRKLLKKIKRNRSCGIDYEDEHKGLPEDVPESQHHPKVVLLHASEKTENYFWRYFLFSPQLLYWSLWKCLGSLHLWWHSIAFTKEENLKLQVLVNKVLRSLTGQDRDTPVTVLTDTSGQISVHQQTALFTLTSVHKALQKQQPAHSYSQLRLNPTHENARNKAKFRVEYKLSISRGSYY